jgi:exodeoxyribonuclease VII small subunit
MAETFEDKLKRLQEIVNMLDQGSVSLNQAIKLYEEGMELAVELRKILDEAELKIIQLNAKYQSNENTKEGE